MVTRSEAWPQALVFAATLVLAPVALSFAARASTSEAEGYVQSAQALLAKGNLPGAAIELRNAARIEPDNAVLHFELAKI